MMTRKDDLKAKFQTGMVPTQQDFAEFIDMFVASINDKEPDNGGNVNTDFKIIDPLGPDRPPTDYPVGASEFYSDYNPNDYAQYIADNPSMSQLEQGQICVRTFRSNGFSYQQVDNVKDGIFNAAYIRLNTSPTAWGVLSPVVSGSITPIDVVDNLLSNSATDALSANQGKVLKGMIDDIEDLATGPQGPKGEDGKDGGRWYIGRYEPLAQDAKPNDVWLNTDTGDVYFFASGVWNNTGGNIKGPQGDTGANGLKGDKGDPGEQGPKGDKGDIGATGATGATGPKGDKGDKGDQGIQGVQGLQGVQGERGEKGDRGEGFVVTMAFPSLQEAEDYLSGPNNTLVDGNFISIANENNPTENGNVYILTDGDFLFQFTAQGVKGETGPTGPQGIQGVPGAQGIQGVKGDKGDTGPQGPKGDPGTNGADGSKGDKGDKGDTGAVGPQGPPGDVGTLPKASTTQEGIVQLTNELNGTSEVLALTQKVGNTLSQGLSSLSISLDNHATHVAVSGLHGSLGHVIPDGTTITVDDDGIISAVSGTSMIDNTITALQAPSTFAHGHTISVVEDSTFDTVFKNLTGAKTNLLKMHFTVDTYNMSDATASYKYYQRIAVSVGDDFNKPNLVGHISRLSTSSSSWGPSYFEPVLFFAEDAQFPIKYSIAGSKLNSIKNNKKYVSVRSEPDNSLTSFWVEEVPPPTVLSLADSPTPPDGEGFVYSAESAKEMIDTHENKKASTTVSGHVKVDGTTITANDGTISVPTASLTSRGIVQLYNSITSDSTVAATPNAVNSAIIAHSNVMSSATVLGHVKVDGTTITSTDGVISATSATIPDATTTVKGKVQLASSVNNATNLATTPAAVQNAINAHVSIIPTTSIRGHVKSDGISTMIDGTGTMKAKTNINRIWDSRPITANATTWTVDFSDEPELTNLNNYDFEVYDDGVLVFGNPITHTVNNANKTVTFTPQTPMSRPFTITCIGRGMEFPQ